MLHGFLEKEISFLRVVCTCMVSYFDSSSIHFHVQLQLGDPPNTYPLVYMYRSDTQVVLHKRVSLSVFLVVPCTMYMYVVSIQLQLTTGMVESLL